jgi:hypothetical protein
MITPMGQPSRVTQLNVHSAWLCSSSSRSVSSSAYSETCS